MYGQLLYRKRYASIVHQVDVAEPGHALASGLTMPILRFLAKRSSPLTAAQIARLGAIGTEAGVRRAVDRLALHGVCSSDEVGGRTVYSLNYDHVLYDAVEAVLKANGELIRRLRKGLGQWNPEPLSAVLFGSAARRDGDARSDIDLLVVRPALRTDTAKRAWARQVHELRSDVDRWTGNRLQVLDWTRGVTMRHAAAEEALIQDLLADGVPIHGVRLSALLADSV